MTSIRMTSVAIAAVSLMTCSAFAQEKAGGGAAPGAAPGVGGAAPGAPSPGGEGGELRPKTGAPGAPAGAARPASPGMAPAGTAEPAPGQRRAGENAGESPERKPVPPAGEARPGAKPEAQPNAAKPAQGENGKPGAMKPAQAPNGQAGAGRPNGASHPAPQITSVQRTRIQETIKSVNVRPINVNFNVAVGVAIPSTVVLEPLPPAIITIVPDYEGYRFFVVPGEIVIVDPYSLDIVAVLPL